MLRCGGLLGKQSGDALEGDVAVAQHHPEILDGHVGEHQSSRMLRSQQPTLAREAERSPQPVGCRPRGQTRPSAWCERPAALIEDDT